MSLRLTPPPGQGEFLRYSFKDGKLTAAKDKSGHSVAVDAFGIPIQK